MRKSRVMSSHTPGRNSLHPNPQPPRQGIGAFVGVLLQALQAALSAAGVEATRTATQVRGRYPVPRAPRTFFLADDAYLYYETNIHKRYILSAPRYPATPTILPSILPVIHCTLYLVSLPRPRSDYPTKIKIETCVDVEPDLKG